MFSRYPDFVLLRYDVILKARDPFVTENVIRETHSNLFQASRQWRAVRIKVVRSYLYACWLSFWLAFFRMTDSTDFYDFLHP